MLANHKMQPQIVDQGRYAPGRSHPAMTHLVELVGIEVLGMPPIRTAPQGTPWMVASKAKSTLMNFLFGCGFATSAGRCTRGAAEIEEG